MGSRSLPGSQQKLTGLRSPKFHAGGSYLDQYRRTQNRETGGYREYTLPEYKKLQKEANYAHMGMLGPDLESEELRERVGRFSWFKCYLFHILSIGVLV